MCGGTPPTPLLRRHCLGLSPRVRGNQVGIVPPGRDGGSIPACAGEPSGEGFQAGAAAVYPRVCGGTRVPLPSAGAGEVYPRVCGGTYRIQLYRDRLEGLSPRVRGNRGELVQSGPRVGSIPACAGEPTQRRLNPAARAVYPRVCGGTTPSPAPRRPAGGLSPRVRGNPGKGARAVTKVGSIPACAGEPHPGIGISWRRTVYPRVCGGTGNLARAAHNAGGLSPRVRGNRGRLAPA